MALLLSLFSDAEMKGVAASAVASSVSVCAAPSVAVPKESAPRAEAQSSLIDEWVKGFHTNINEERERLGSVRGYGVNPCIHCKYRGMCDDDYCAMLLHPIDMNHKPTARGWRNYGL